MRTLKLTLVTALVAVSWAASPIFGEKVADIIVKDFKVDPGWAFGLCGNLKVPCGYFMANDDQASNPNIKRKKVYMAKGTIREALGKLTADNPDYDWTEEDGVINILPKPSRQHLENGSNPLDRIVEIDVSSVTTAHAAHLILKASGLPVGGRVYVGPRQHFATISLKLKKVTLRKALNRLVRSDGMAVWGLEYYPEHKNYILDINSWRRAPSLFGPQDNRKKP